MGLIMENDYKTTYQHFDSIIRAIDLRVTQNKLAKYNKIAAHFRAVMQEHGVKKVNYIDSFKYTFSY